MELDVTAPPDRPSRARWSRRHLQNSLDRLEVPDRNRLSDCERRHVTLSVVATTGHPLTLTQLARKTLTADAGKAVADADVPPELVIELHHNHLPMMDDLGVIDYDHVHHRITVPLARNRTPKAEP